MSVIEYRKEFDRLARFCRYLVPDDDRKIERFNRGLRGDLRIGSVALTAGKTYTQAVEAIRKLDNTKQ